MNHWFLCARDVMWVLITLMPLALALFAGVESKKEDSNGSEVELLFLAVAWQVIFVVVLYMGWIK